MKTRFSVLSLGLLLGLGLYSCSSAEEEFIPEEQQVEIKLTSAILTPETRGANASEQSTQIISGQAVGVTIANASAAHDNVQWNVGTNGALTSTSTSPIYYATTAATITAYHPYNAAWSTLTTQQFSVQEDQSADGYKNSDLLWTTKTQERTAGNVSLIFAHKLAKVNVNLTSSTFTDTELATATISIASVELNTGIDLSTGALSAATTSNVGEIVAAKNSATASAIVVPQTVASGKVLIKVKLGSAVYGYTLPSNVTFAAGTSYTYNMTLTKHEVKLDSSSITDWTANTPTDVVGEELPIESDEYVDLGLPSGTLWATCNLGADAPEQEGKQYAWGEIIAKSEIIEGYGSWTGEKNANYVTGETRTTYDKDHYKWTANYSYSKYNETDGKIMLESFDDAATINLGEEWCIPTPDQLTELRENCSASWTTVNHVSGMKVVGPNGNYIFLPATGYTQGTGTYSGVINKSIYWSSGLRNVSMGYVNSLSFEGKGTKLDQGTMDKRHIGGAIRPVRK